MTVPVHPAGYSYFASRVKTSTASWPAQFSAYSRAGWRNRTRSQSARPASAAWRRWWETTLSSIPVIPARSVGHWLETARMLSSLTRLGSEKTLASEASSAASLGLRAARIPQPGGFEGFGVLRRIVAHAMKPHQERNGGDTGPGSLDQRDPLARPVGIVQLDKESEFIQRETGPDTERQAQQELSTVLTREDRGRARHGGDEHAGNEVMHAHLVRTRSVIRPADETAKSRRCALVLAYVGDRPSDGDRERT